MNSFAATIPILIVVLSAIAAMLAEAIRHPGERMYIAGFGLIGLVGALVASCFLWRPWFAAFAATGVILSAVYMLWMFQRVNYGRITNEKNRALPDLSPREWSMLIPTIAMAIVMGVFPNVFMRPMEASVRQTIERVTGRSYAAQLRMTATVQGGDRTRDGKDQPVSTSDARRPASVQFPNRISPAPLAVSPPAVSAELARPRVVAAELWQPPAESGGANRGRPNVAAVTPVLAAGSAQ